jgi:DNA-binding transcriptional LysR family regulator
MSRRMPRLEVIEAFIEAARSPNFRTAAERCALSPAAFSRRIQAFAQFADCEVFEKTARGMRLTQAGQEFLAELEPIYLDMRRAALDLARRTDQQRIVLSIYHSLAVGWLIPRLGSFHLRHPGIDVVVLTERTAESIRSGDVDLGVCSVDIDLTGLTVQPLWDFHISPVAAPDIAASFREGRSSLADSRILGVFHAPNIWPWWCGRAGIDSATLGPKLPFDVLNAMYEASAAGLGVAPGSYPTVGPFLRSGRLEHLGLPIVRHAGGDCLAATESRLRKPAVRQFWRWLAAEARSCPMDWSDDTVGILARVEPIRATQPGSIFA